jgi:hypothetical protein
MRRGGGGHDFVFDNEANALIGVGMNAHVPKKCIIQHQESVMMLRVDVHAASAVGGEDDFLGTLRRALAVVLGRCVSHSKYGISQVTRHTSHVTRHSSHLIAALVGLEAEAQEVTAVALCGKR